MYSDNSWGRRLFDVRRQTDQKFSKKFFPNISKNFFALKNTFKSSQHKKSQNFFVVKSAFSFLRPKDQPFTQ